MTSLMEDVDDRFAGIDIDSLLNGQRRPLSFERKKALYEAPEFIQRLNGEETVMEGQSLCIECKIRGFPVPRLRWFKDDEEIVDHPRIHVESDGIGGYYLFLDHVTRADEAAYRCRAENVEGACSSFFFLSVTGKPKRRETIPSWRTVSFPPMFSTIMEKVEEEETQGKELEELPPSPMTEFYYALTLNSRSSWPTFLGDWAFANNKHPFKRQSSISDEDDAAGTVEEDEEDNDGLGAAFFPNDDICDKLKYHNSSKAHFAAKRSSRKNVKSKTKKPKLENKAVKEADTGHFVNESDRSCENENEKNKVKTEIDLDINEMQKATLLENPEIESRLQGPNATKDEMKRMTKEEIAMPSLTFYKDTKDLDIVTLSEYNNHRESTMRTEEITDKDNKKGNVVETSRRVVLTKQIEEDGENLYDNTKQRQVSTSLQNGGEADEKRKENNAKLVCSSFKDERETNKEKLPQTVYGQGIEKSLLSNTETDVRNKYKDIDMEFNSSSNTAPEPNSLRIFRLDIPEAGSVTNQDKLWQFRNVESPFRYNVDSNKNEQSSPVSERNHISPCRYNVESDRHERSPFRYNDASERNDRSTFKYKDEFQRNEKSLSRYNVEPVRSERSPFRYNVEPDRSERSPFRYNVEPDRSEKSPLRYTSESDRIERSPFRFSVESERNEKSPLRYTSESDRIERSPFRYSVESERNDKSPLRYTSQSDRIERCPFRYSVESERNEKSPLRYTSESDRIERSPFRYSVEAERNEKSPLRYTSESDRIERSPFRYSVESERNEKSPLRYTSESDRIERSPFRYIVESERNEKSPLRYTSESDRIERSPFRYSVESERNEKSPLRYTSESDRYEKSPFRYTDAPERNEKSPLRYNAEPERSERSPFNCSAEYDVKGGNTHCQKQSVEEYKAYPLRQNTYKNTTKPQQTKVRGKDRLEELREQEVKRMDELKQEEQKRLKELKHEGETKTYTYKRANIKYEDVRESERKQIEELRRKEKFLREDLHQKEQKQLEDLRRKEGSLIEEMKSQEHKFSEPLTCYEQGQREQSLMKDREDLRLKEQNQMEELKEKESIQKGEFILKESMQIEDMKGHERKFKEEMKFKDRKYYDLAEYEFEKEEAELEEKKKVKEREMSLQIKKEQMMKEQLKRQYEEEMQKRIKQEDEARKQRLLRLDVDKESKFMKTLQNRNMWLREETFIPSGRILSNKSFSDAETKQTMSLRIKSMEDTDLTTTKLQHSKTNVRSSFTNSLDRRSRRTSANHSYLTVVNDKENDSRYTNRTVGDRQSDSTSHSVDSDASSSLSDKYPKSPNLPVVQKPLSFASFFAIEESRVAKPSHRTHDDLFKLADSIAAKRERFHEFISHCSNEDTESSNPTQKEKTAFQDGEADHGVNSRKQELDVSNRPGRTMNAGYFNGTDHAPHRGIPERKYQSASSSTRLADNSKEDTSSGFSLMEMRPFVYNSARTTARRFYQKD